MPNSAVKPLILVVEDDPAVRNLIVAALEAHGLRHMAVETAHAAIAAASSQAADKISLLQAGADDYLTKPFSVEELLARIRTTLRRLSYAQTGGVVSEGSFDTGELHIDFDAGIATMDGEELHLTPIEYKLLCLLAHNADKVLTHQFILHEIWGTATKSDLASLRVFMGTLRKKIESDPAHPRYIQTHVGIGYRLVIQG